MLQKVHKFIRTQHLFNPGDTVIVAVSGGADSVALLDLLVCLHHLKLRLIIAHVNHCLRGAESEADEAFVRQLADNHGLALVTEAVDVLELSRQQKMSLEEAGRVARYRFFKMVAQQYQAQSVALAHHADDQAETVLMRMIRGAGGSGLRAMKARTAGLFVRPLLSVTRCEIEAYLGKKQLTFRTDSSNGDHKFFRNRVRHELIPLLKSYNPAITDRLITTAAALSEDEDILSRITTETFARLTSVRDDAIIVGSLARELRGVRMRLYRHVLHQLRGDLAHIGSIHLGDIDALMSSAAPHGMLNLPGGVVVKKCYEQLLFQRHDVAAHEPYEFVIQGPGRYPIAGGGVLSIEVAETLPCWSDIASTVAYFDQEVVSFPWQVRTFRDGDAFSPLGMGRTKKIKNLFVDRKIPLHHRRRIPLLWSGETLFWVGGIMPARAGRVTSTTTTIVKAELVDFTA